LPNYQSSTSAKLARQLDQLLHRLNPINNAHAGATASNFGDFASYWTGTSSEHLRFPPGGGFEENEVYPDENFLEGELITNVNNKTYLQMQLQSNFGRDDGDGGVYKPTLFGDILGTTEVLSILSLGVPSDMEAGSHEFCVSENENTQALALVDCPETIDPDGEIELIRTDIADVSSEDSVFDRALALYFGDEVDPFAHYWIKNSNLSFSILQLEPGGGDADAYGIQFLSFNKQSNAIIFEELQVTEAYEDDAGEIDFSRFYTEGSETGLTVLSIFSGNIGEGSNHSAIALASIG